MEYCADVDIQSLKESINQLAFCLNENVNSSDVKFSDKKWSAISNTGYLGLIAEKQYQGLELDIATTMDLIEELGFVCDDAGLTFSVVTQLISAQLPLMKFGTVEQKQKYMPSLVDGSIISAHSITEPDSGSDAYAMKTTAIKTEDGYILNGTKTFATNGPIADLIIVYALTDPKKGVFGGISTFLVDKSTPGLTTGEPLDKMGLSSSPIGEIHFDNCKISSTQLLSKPGAGYRILEYVMATEVLLIAISQIGEMKRLINECVKHSKSRKQYGKPIAKNQAVSHKIVDMKIALEAARSLAYSTAQDLINNNDDFAVKLSAVKVLTSETYVKCALDMIQIFGAYGYVKEFGVEKHLRDAVGSKIYSGTSEVHRNRVANLLGL